MIPPAPSDSNNGEPTNPDVATATAVHAALAEVLPSDRYQTRVATGAWFGFVGIAVTRLPTPPDRSYTSWTFGTDRLRRPGLRDRWSVSTITGTDAITGLAGITSIDITTDADTTPSPDADPITIARWIVAHVTNHP